MDKVESTILRHLLFSEEYFRKVVPFLKPEYFDDQSERAIFEEIQDFSVKYDTVPTAEVVNVGLGKRSDLSEEQFQQSSVKVEEYNRINKEDPALPDQEWLLDTTEKWCQERAVYNALLQSIKIADGNDEKLTTDAIPSILQDALAV